MGGRILGVPGRSKVFSHLDRSHLESRREGAEQRAPSHSGTPAGEKRGPGGLWLPGLLSDPARTAPHLRLGKPGRQPSGLRGSPRVPALRTAVSVCVI